MDPQDHSACHSSTPETATTSESRRKAGRHPVLDEGKQQQILAILAAGGSRRTAARYVGCAPGTITQTAGRDAAFAERLARAEQSAEIQWIRLIHKAASQAQYWRAAAWMLERRNPEDFALRKPDTFTAREVQEQIATVLDLVVEAVPAECRAQVVEKLNSVSAGIDVRFRPADWNGRHAAAGPLPEETPPQCNVSKAPIAKNAADESCPRQHEPQAGPQDKAGATCIRDDSAASPRFSQGERPAIVEHPTFEPSEVGFHAPVASAAVSTTCARATRRIPMRQRRRRAKSTPVLPTRRPSSDPGVIAGSPCAAHSVK